MPGKPTQIAVKAGSRSAAFVEAAECLQALAHPVRLRMVQVLLNRRLTVKELAEICGVPIDAVMEHLRLMQRCGFFASKRDGGDLLYEVTEPQLSRLLVCGNGRCGVGA